MEPVQEDMASRRRRMVQEQIVHRGIEDENVIQAMLFVKRELFVGAMHLDACYGDGPLPIKAGQTISQPYVVAYMSQLLSVSKHHRVLEIGCGSGYQAAVLAHICAHVYTIERIAVLYEQAQTLLLETLKLQNVTVLNGDGALGAPDYAPFDRILISAAVPSAILPRALLYQLALGGVVVAPMGTNTQHIYKIEKKETGIESQAYLPVSFVPFITNEID